MSRCQASNQVNYQGPLLEAFFFSFGAVFLHLHCKFVTLGTEFWHLCTKFVSFGAVFWHLRTKFVSFGAVLWHVRHKSNVRLLFCNFNSLPLNVSNFLQNFFHSSMFTCNCWNNKIRSSLGNWHHSTLLLTKYLDQNKYSAAKETLIPSTSIAMPEILVINHLYFFQYYVLCLLCPIVDAYIMMEVQERN